MLLNKFLFYLLFSCLLVAGCTDRPPKEVIEEFSKAVIVQDFSEAKSYIDSKYWEYLEEDLDLTKRLNYTTSSIYFKTIDTIDCKIFDNKAVCKVCSVFLDSTRRCPEIVLIRTRGYWVIGKGVYMPVCCD